jgi:predicted MarR family transcription regulator
METSNNFNIEDIHNIRYANYEKTKHLLPKELIEKTKAEATKGWEKLSELKIKKAN